MRTTFRDSLLVVHARFPRDKLKPRKYVRAASGTGPASILESQRLSCVRGVRRKTERDGVTARGAASRGGLAALAAAFRSISRLPSGAVFLIGALTACSAGTDTGSLQVRSRVADEWQVFSYRFKALPVSEPGPESNPDSLASVLAALARANYGNIDGVITLVVPVQVLSECPQGGTAAASGATPARAGDECLAPNPLLGRVAMAADKGRAPILCPFEDKSWCLEDAVVLESVQNHPDPGQRCRTRADLCLHATGYDRARNLWVICTIGGRGRSAQPHPASTSQLCLRKYETFHLGKP